MGPELSSAEKLRALEQRTARQLKQLTKRKVTSVRVRFYPYSRPSHTARVRDGKIYIRISDILTDAPVNVLGAVTCLLIHKLLDSKPPPGQRSLYRRYLDQPRVRARIQKVRRKRARELRDCPSGSVFDLRTLFEDLNQRYFDARLEIQILSWSRRRNKSVMGYFDSAHKAIVINRALDNPLVPEYVVQYVLYHEMLHAHLGEETAACGIRKVHHARFKQAEKQFPQFQRAQDFIHKYFA